jgi:hypothetical protein
MKLEQHIKDYLNEHGKVVVPNLGTFTATYASASLQSPSGVMAPPSQRIEFTEDTSSVSDASIAKYMVSDGKADLESLKFELEAFTNGIKNSLRSYNKSELHGLGVFTKPDGGTIKFQQSDESTAMPDTFGLPKIEVRPLVPALITDNKPEPAANKLMLWAILIPLVVFSVIGIYWLTTPDAFKALTSYFSSAPQQPVHSDEGNTPKVIEGDSLPKADQPKADTGAEAGKADQPKADTPKADQPKAEPKPAEQPKADAGGSNGVVTSPTGRNYIIIGSFTTVASAQKAVEKCKKVGYANAKVVQVGGRIRVSVNDFANRGEADDFAAKAGKDYPGAWVLVN